MEVATEYAASKGIEYVAASEKGAVPTQADLWDRLE